MQQDPPVPPPRWAHRLLTRLLPADLQEELEGDLQEQYAQHVAQYGLRKARRLYLLEVLKFARPYFIRRNRKTSFTPRSRSAMPSLDMLANYLTIALRNLLRHKAFSFINVLGLATGMTCSILILLWVQDELGYDRFHRRAGQLYRITCRAGEAKAAVSPAALAGALKAQMPAVKNTVRMMAASHLLEASNHKFQEQRIYYVDASFLEMFSFPLRQGDARTALQRPDGILMTETMARKYFGKAEALGRTLRQDNGDPVTVTGVLADVPGNSHLQFDFIRPMAAIAGTNEILKNNRWDSFNFFTYLQLDENFAAAPERLPGLSGQITRIFHKNFPEFKVEFQLQPLGRIHLHSEILVGDVTGHGNIQYVRIFFVVALFILAVAAINFMNLATARSARRAKEVGLRKVIGAGRLQLVGQFLGESLLISFLGLLLAVGFVWLLLPLFNDLADKRLVLHFGDGKLVGSLLAIALLTGLLSGGYPALFLSHFQPVAVLKGNLRSGRGNVWFRNGLVVVQFVVSLVLLVGTAVVYQQLQYIKNRNLGFQKENLLYLSMTGELWSKYQALRTELARNPLTAAYAATQDLPTNIVSADYNVQWEGKDPRTQPMFYTMAVDENFIGVFGMKMLSGRSFSREFRADSSNFIVNEKALRLMGMDPATAVGKSLAYYDTKGTIIGVVQDFNFKPIQQPIEPLVMRLNTWGGNIVVRTRPGQTEATIAALGQIWGKLNPAYPFTYQFLDQDLARLYRGEQRLGSLFNVFAGLAIFISCLGLYGLSAFMAEQRTREIGVRKVFGASLFHLVYLLSRQFTRLILVAMAIALPLAWFMVARWLEGFAYHVDLGWPVFGAACLICLLVAGITVSYESIKAALMNPASAFRRE